MLYMRASAPVDPERKPHPLTSYDRARLPVGLCHGALEHVDEPNEEPVPYAIVVSATKPVPFEAP